jgi:hypothetical protein
MGYRSDVTYIVTFNCVDQPEKAYAQFVHFYEWVTKHHKISTDVAQQSGHYDYNNVIALWVTASSIGTWTR